MSSLPTDYRPPAEPIKADRMAEIEEAVKKGQPDRARALIGAHPVDVLKTTQEQQKLISSLYLNVSLQQKLTGALTAYMSATMKLASALDTKLSSNELAGMKPKDLVDMASKMKRVMDPAIDIAMAVVKLDSDDTPKNFNVTLNVIKKLVAARHAMGDSPLDGSDVSDVSEDPPGRE